MVHRVSRNSLSGSTRPLSVRSKSRSKLTIERLWRSASAYWYASSKSSRNFSQYSKSREKSSRCSESRVIPLFRISSFTRFRKGSGFFSRAKMIPMENREKSLMASRDMSARLKNSLTAGAFSYFSMTSRKILVSTKYISGPPVKRLVLEIDR